MEQEGSTKHSYVKRTCVCFTSHRMLTRVTDDNKVWSTKPIVSQFKVDSFPLLPAVLKDQNCFTSILFSLLQVNGILLKLSNRIGNEYINFVWNFSSHLCLFSKFPIPGIKKRPCSFETSLFLLDLKCHLINKFVDVTSILVFAFALQVPQGQPYQVQRLTTADAVVLHQFQGVLEWRSCQVLVALGSVGGVVGGVGGVGRVLSACCWRCIRWCCWVVYLAVLLAVLLAE